MHSISGQKSFKLSTNCSTQKVLLTPDGRATIKLLGFSNRNDITIATEQSSTEHNYLLQNIQHKKHSRTDVICFLHIGQVCRCCVQFIHATKCLQGSKTVFHCGSKHTQHLQLVQFFASGKGSSSLYRTPWKKTIFRGSGGVFCSSWITPLCPSVFWMSGQLRLCLKH